MDQEKKEANHTHHSTATGYTHELFSRARQIIRRDGKKIHVASSPQEVEGLRRKLSSVNAPNDDWDIVIHGSGEHVDALRDAHSHHEVLREELKVKHGKDFEDIEKIVKELDRLSQELHMVSEHAVNLDANFSKYGYSAHLRSIPKSGENSSTGSMMDGHSHHDHRDWDAEKTKGEHMVFFRMPVMRQYFHKGLLWRASDATEVASYELFLDLMYVAILAITGDAASEEATGHSLLWFAITYIMAWKIWSDISTVVAWISMDDILRRILSLLALILLLGLATNMMAASHETYTPLVAFYVASRVLWVLYFVWMAYLMPMVRPSMIGTALNFLLTAVLWIGSIHVHDPERQAIIWIAIFFDFFGPTILVAVSRGGDWLGKLQPWVKRTFEFIPGTNIEHRIERTNAFVALVFGYSVVALFYQSSVAFGINGFFGKACLGLIQSFIFNWIYFEIDNFNMHTHAIRRHFVSALFWLSIHLPFTMAFVLAGSALNKLVLAHDTPDADTHDLYHPYDTRSEEEIHLGQIWFYCAGLAIALASTGGIAMSHSTRTIPNARLKKPYRLVYRFAVSIAILLLPLAHHHLNSLHYVATTTCLVASVLLLELAGSSCGGDSFWGFSEHRKCSYSANCKLSRGELQEKAKTGEAVDVEAMAKNQNREHADLSV